MRWWGMSVVGSRIGWFPGYGLRKRGSRLKVQGTRYKVQGTGKRRVTLICSADVPSHWRTGALRLKGSGFRVQGSGKDGLRFTERNGLGGAWTGSEWLKGAAEPPHNV